MDSLFRGALGAPFALRVSFFVLLGTLLTAAFAESAHAGVITASDKAVVVLGGGERNDISYTSRAVEPNGSDDGTLVRVTDAGSPLVVVEGSPCHAVATPAVAKTVECRLETYRAGLVQLFLGGGDDIVREPYDALLPEGHFTRLFTRAEVDGGDGDDGITGSYLGDTLRGGPGDDRINGGGGTDGIDGGDGDDKLVGRGAVAWTQNDYLGDAISGGAGRDRLVGGTGDDALNGGTGKDTIKSGSGRDTINSRDGVKDIVGCDGPGDALTADPIDKFRGCIFL